MNNRNKICIIIFFTSMVLAGFTFNNKIQVDIREELNFTTNDENMTLPLTPSYTLPYYLESASTEYRSVGSTFDVNEDGLLDIFLVQNSPDYFLMMNASGTVYWSQPRVYGPGWTRGDFDRDGKIDDILNFVRSGFTFGTMCAWNESGDLISQSENLSVQYPSSFLPLYDNDVNRRVGDFNQDGYMDDIITYFWLSPFDYYFGAINVPSQTSLWNFSLGLWAKQLDYLPADLNNNGYVDNFIITSSNNITYALDSDGMPLWTFTCGGERTYLHHSISVGDLDHDTFEDDVIIISPANNSIYAINNSGNLLWNFTSLTARSVRVVDYDNDGFSDEVIVIENDSVLLLNESGNLLWRCQPGSSTLRNLRVYDVTSDGSEDYLISGRSVVVINHTGEVLWSYDIGITHEPIAVLDLDEDGVRNESLWWADGEMILFRWGFPNVTVSFREAPQWRVPIDTDHTLWVDLINHQPVPLNINCTLNTSTVVWTASLDPLEIESGGFIISSDTVQDINYRVEIQYGGIPFAVADIRVSFIESISFTTISLVIGVLYILMISKKMFKNEKCHQ